ncbi:uncharacterized protein LOC109861405 [Pseudomyrmex gracilis]|uniref:uncharacterized protein LOC109861405 n=1 Tax=Pseudomyrmex gracilis TaxID=219809 RepID=UPI000994E8A0|nr:uncharacterized protein LOC109861405 [Pseudomyrmex gracilis]
MSQPTLNSSLSGINFVGMNRGGNRLSYTSLRATSGDNSINEEERLSTPNVHALGGSGSHRGSLTMERSSSRLSQPDVRRFALRQDKRERLSQPTLITGDYYPGRGQQRLSQPCLSSGRDSFGVPSPPPFPIKHKRFAPAFMQASQRDRLSQLDIGAKYRNLKPDLGSGTSQVKFNRDRFSIPELETQNDLRLIAGTPKQRFSLDSQLTKQRFSLDSQDSCKSRLLPIASSPIFEHQQMKTEELTGITTGKLKSPTCEGLESVIVASTSPIFPPGERRFLAPDFPFTGRKTSTSPSPPKSDVTPVGKTRGKPPPIPVRERMSVPEIRNSSLRRLLDPPVRQRHSIAGNLRQSLLSPVKLPEFGTSGRKSPRYSIDDALEKLKRIEKEENRKNQEMNEVKEQKNKDQEQHQQQQHEQQEPKHIQRHYSYTYETTGSDESSSVSTLGKLSVGGTPKRKYLESNFDENEQVITTVIETEMPIILPSTPAKYAKKTQVYSNETPKWIRKYLENESPKVGQKFTSSGSNKDQINKIDRRTSRRKSSLESIETVTKKPEEKVRSKSVSCEERNTKGIQEQKGVKETYVRIVPSSNAQEENRYEITVDSITWTKNDNRGLYGDDTDTDDSTSI